MEGTFAAKVNGSAARTGLEEYPLPEDGRDFVIRYGNVLEAKAGRGSIGSCREHSAPKLDVAIQRGARFGAN
jgi:hypothetical protein